MKKNKMILSGAILHIEQGEKHDAAIIISDGKIEKIISAEEVKNISSAHIIEFSEQYHILPGFIDLHIHGTKGADVMDADYESLKTIAETIAKQGTTSFLATTMTASSQEIENVLCHVRDYVKRQDLIQGAKILGVHLEGPFISPGNAGAQQAAATMLPNIALMETWQKRSQNMIKLVTLAPELENGHEFIRYLRKNNIVASIGHTKATYAETQKAIECGCTHATHLFNAMTGLHHRDHRVVGAILESNAVTAELIVDGVHVHPAAVNLAFQQKGVEKLVLVTDAMRATCMHDGEYDLGGQAVIVKNAIARLENGVLAGSTLTMSEAVKNMRKFTACTFDEIVKMTSENPAKIAGIFHQKGSITQGKDADLVVMNQEGEVKMTLCRGRVV